MTLAAASGDNSRNLFAMPAIVADRRADGSIVVRSTVPLQPDARCIGDWLEHWARQAPDRIFLADRTSADGPWSTVTYKDALQQVRSAAAWILAQGLSTERPLVILSDNSVEHALFALAAQHVGVPSAAISPAYSLMSKDFDKLKSMITLLGPGAIYVAGTKPFAAALAAIQPLHSATIVSGSAGDTGAISFHSIAATPETPDVEKAFAAITPDTIAKFLFTSGSTGTPKAVINTQRMLTRASRPRRRPGRSSKIPARIS
jgi:feruloyl-CoA synthase